MKRQPYMGNRSHFDSLAEALDAAIGRAIMDDHYEFDEKEIERFRDSMGPVNYGETKRGTLPVWKFRGRLFGHTRALTVILYRMESGRYELTSYVN